MTTLQIPSSLVEEAKKLGVDLDPNVKFSAYQPLLKLSEQYGGIDPQFGEEDCTFADESEFGSFLRHIVGRKADRSFRKGVKSVGKVAGQVAKVGLKVGAVASFAIPGAGPLVGGSALAAMKAADKVLGGSSKKHKAKIVSNTKAMAALGDPHARRGATVLATVDQIRKQKAVPQGKPAIPGPAPVKVQRYIKMIPQVTANALAATKVATAASLPKKTFWMWVKEKFHIKAKATATATHGCCT